MGFLGTDGDSGFPISPRRSISEGRRSWTSTPDLPHKNKNKSNHGVHNTEQAGTYPPRRKIMDVQTKTSSGLETSAPQGAPSVSSVEDVSLQINLSEAASHQKHLQASSEQNRQLLLAALEQYQQKQQCRNIVSLVQQHRNLEAVAQLAGGQVETRLALAQQLGLLNTAGTDHSANEKQIRAPSSSAVSKKKLFTHVDQTLLRVVSHFRDDWEAIGNYMGTDPDDCRKRWEELQNQGTQENSVGADQLNMLATVARQTSWGSHNGDAETGTVICVDEDEDKAKENHGEKTKPGQPCFLNQEQSSESTHDECSPDKSVSDEAVPSSSPLKKEEHHDDESDPNVGEKRKYANDDPRENQTSDEATSNTPVSSSMEPPKKRVRGGFFFKVTKLLPGKLQEQLGFLALPKDATFQEARIKIRDELELGDDWAFFLPTLGPVSRKQEFKLGTMVSWLNVKHKAMAGSRRNPISIYLVDKSK